MLRPRYHVITAIGGAQDNVVGFRCAPFCVPNEDLKPIFPFPTIDISKDIESDSPSLKPIHPACVYASIHQAVLLKAVTFGFTPIGSQDMITLLWKMNPNLHISELVKKGVSLKQALEEILQSEEVLAGGVLETISPSYFSDDYERGKRLALLETHRCITDYLANGLPVIVSFPEGKHSILLLGMHLLHDPEESKTHKLECIFCDPDRTDINELPGRFVVHDISLGPFAEISASELLSRAWVENEGVSFLVIAPHGTNIGIHEVRDSAKDLIPAEEPNFWAKYIKDHGLSDELIPNDPDDMRYVTRFLHSNQVIYRYFSKRQDKIISPRDEVYTKLKKNGFNDKQYWWCIEVRIRKHQFAVSDIQLRVPPALIYIWQVEDNQAKPRFIIKYSGNKKAILSVVDTNYEEPYEFTPYPA